MDNQDRIAPADMLKVLACIAELDWRPLHSSEHQLFAEAGPDAQIADVTDIHHGTICELLDLRIPAAMGMLAIIGGDGLQIELLGTTEDGEPIAWTLPLAPFEH